MLPDYGYFAPRRKIHAEDNTEHCEPPHHAYMLVQEQHRCDGDHYIGHAAYRHSDAQIDLVKNGDPNKKIKGVRKRKPGRQITEKGKKFLESIN